VGKLYLPIYTNGDRFLCRECYDLGYRSSRNSGNELERAEQRYRKAFAKADAEDRRPHPNNLPYTPDRPKGTHRDTFADLVEDVREAKREWREEMDSRTRDLLADMGAGAEDAAGAFGYTDR
jgi:ribosome-binding protein aMBF1 (putative translation factor)